MASVWYVTIVGVALAFAGTYYLYKALRRTTGKLKEGLAFLLLAAAFGPPSHLIVAYFGITNLNINNDLWNIVPVFFTLAMVFVVLSMRALVGLFEELTKETSGHAPTS